MPDDKPLGAQVQQWISVGATIIAPVTVIGAVLFYFGYVSSRAEYQYFGVDVDTIGLNTQGYVMRSPQSLLVPLLVLVVGVAGFLLMNTAIRGRIASTVEEAGSDSVEGDTPTGSARQLGRIHRSLEVLVRVGLILLVAGIVMLFAYAYLGGWSAYPLFTPLLIAAGATCIAYGLSLEAYVQRLQDESENEVAGVGRTRKRALAHPRASVSAKRTAAVLIYAVIVASVFWAIATVAQWTGRGIAQHQAKHLGGLPSVVLDTKERLFLRDPGIEETLLPGSEGQTFHYRYRGLRLLIVGQDRMFLVPAQWSASDSTLVVPLDESVRVQFQFQNQRP